MTTFVEILKSAFDGIVNGSEARQLRL